jgi:hypothetical protein
LEYISKAGKWAYAIAEKIGVGVVIFAFKAILGY